jgi:hypothetical protein
MLSPVRIICNLVVILYKNSSKWASEPEFPPTLLALSLSPNFRPIQLVTDARILNSGIIFENDLDNTDRIYFKYCNSVQKNRYTTDFEECHFLGCNAVWLLLEPSFRGTYHSQHYCGKNDPAKNNNKKQLLILFLARWFVPEWWWSGIPPNGGPHKSQMASHSIRQHSS